MKDDRFWDRRLLQLLETLPDDRLVELSDHYKSRWLEERKAKRAIFQIIDGGRHDQKLKPAVHH